MKHLLLPLSLIATQAQAQIVYTDVIPDQIYDATNDTCLLDLDNDGNTDFLLTYYVAYSTTCPTLCSVPVLHPKSTWAIPTGSNAVADTTPSVGTYYASCSSVNAVIDQSLEWSSSSRRLRSHAVTCASMPVVHCTTYLWQGYWSAVTVDSSRYLGLRFDIGGTLHYGWARLSIPGNLSSFTLKDYAYNSVPDEFILAGDTGTSISTGIADILQRTVQVTPNPFSSTLSVSLGAENPGDIIWTVHALTGEVLVERTVARLNGRSSITLDLASLARGMYMLELVIDGDRIVRKIMRE